MTELVEDTYTEPEIQFLLQEHAKRSFRFFCHDILGFTDMNQEHDALCEFLQYDPATTKLILMPRYTFKSSILTIGYTLWRLMNDPNERVLLYSDATEKAEGFLTSIKNHLLGLITTSTFRALYESPWEVDPKRGVWNQSAIVVAPRTLAHAEPSVDTAGLETSKVGKHYSQITFDDLVSDKNVTTKELMDKVEQCYKKALSLLMPSGTVALAGTRWHFGDLYGRLIAEYTGRDTFALFHRKASEGERYFFANIGKDSLTPAFLAQKKATQGSALFSCNPGEAPILMGDFSCKRIDQIKAGDEVVGFMTLSDDGKAKHRLIKTTVLKVQSRLADVVKVTLKSGRILRCTPDHRWYTGRSPNDKTHRQYMPAKIGRKMMFVFEPSTSECPKELSRLSAWMGGIFDGEGHCKKGSINLAQSPIHNPQVHSQIGTALQMLGFDYGLTDGKGYWINGGPEAKRRFMEWCDPVKKQTIVESLYYRGQQFIKERDVVVSIEPDGEESVYALVTGTGNYIVWGYASKNCLYQNEPTDEETATFKAADFRFYDPARTEAFDQWTKTLYITAVLDAIPPPTSDHGDDAAITVVGTDSEHTLFLLEAVAGRLSPEQQIEEVLSLHARWGFRKVGLETNAFQRMLKSALERRLSELRMQRTWQPFSIVEFQGLTQGNKEQRIQGLQPWHERGAVRFPGTKLALLTGVWSTLAFQMLQFPHSQKDDLLDSLAYHLQLTQPGSRHLAPTELPYTSAAWFEREQRKAELKVMARRPRWQRPPLVPLAFS